MGSLSNCSDGVSWSDLWLDLSKYPLTINGVVQQEEGNEDMNYAIVSLNDINNYADEEAAMVAAKRFTSKNQKTYFVMKAIAKVETPVPEAVVTKL